MTEPKQVKMDFFDWAVLATCLIVIIAFIRDNGFGLPTFFFMLANYFIGFFAATKINATRLT